MAWSTSARKCSLAHETSGHDRVRGRSACWSTSAAHSPSGVPPALSTNPPPPSRLFLDTQKLHVTLPLDQVLPWVQAPAGALPAPAAIASLHGASRRSSVPASPHGQAPAPAGCSCPTLPRSAALHPAGRQRRRVEAVDEREEEERRAAGVNYAIERWPALDRVRAPKRKKWAGLGNGVHVAGEQSEHACTPAWGAWHRTASTAGVVRAHGLPGTAS